MKKKILCLALFGAMGLVHTAMAQDYDDRWYLAGSFGYNFQDNSRLNYNAPFGTLGVGKPLSPNWALELNFNAQDPRERSPDSGMHWQQYGVSLDALYHFRKEGRNWNPYLRAGLGWQHNREGFFFAGLPVKHSSDNVAAVFGAGLEAQYGRYGIRTEVGARLDDFGNSVNAPSTGHFVDLLASVGVTVALGPEPVKAVEPAPAPAPVVTCADKDSDGDGVNDCNDKCPNTPPGTAVGPDGCPVPVTIDLRGVNFDFDKSKLRPDSISILNEAVAVLKKYPQLRVEVAGHTDSIGSDAYNMKLSERRAKVVYDFLVKNGVDTGRLVGPHGYGKTRPIAPNTNPDGSDNPKGRAENRRTELNVQN
ncbi:MAG: OmpA family protein [Proteobacteria bacterium]|nr:OmpA family protein [Pseudomonadota bacterium]MBS0461339.1 OmpA family protein [Pseudomonadota bacterium]MBS0463402.1 OmpA family protein [Pseudomonadota bacterium]